MEKNIGTYICAGCEIGESLNMDALKNISQDEFKSKVCRTHKALCSKEGIEQIQSDIKKEQLNGIAIAACSPRVLADKFLFDKSVLCERINLREQVVWCGEPNDEDSQMLAEDYLRMGITKLQTTSVPEPFIGDELSSDVLVIGGGISGITAAIEGVKAGYKIILIEKENILGGWAIELHKRLPCNFPFNQLEEPGVQNKIDEISTLENIQVFTGSLIKEISGQPGMFEVTVEGSSGETKFSIGSIVSAMGWKPYDASKLFDLGYGKFENVITNIELEKQAKSGKIAKPSDGSIPENVLFVQCAGSRDEKHLSYCSSYCCGTSLKQAKYFREFNKETSVFIIYKDIRTPGQYENFYKEVQKDEQIFLTKGDIKSINEENGKLVVVANNTLLGEEITIEIDLIVLATGMTPANSEELNLKYRLGKGLPSLKYDFPDSHFICFPYETRRTGIYATGSLRSPMDMSACEEDAAGAMLKAIQCMEAVKRGEAVHPRAGDQSYPDLYMDRCTDCKRCTEECPFGAYDENEKGTPLPNTNRCRRCAICLGSCPERVISFSDYSINSISAMIKSVHVPDEFEEKPRILAFVCENDAYPAFDMAGFKRHKYSAFVRIIPVRCIGSVNKVWISDALSKGFDGILQIGCKPGDDYQCHSIHGSELTETRSENIQETLTTMMLEEERIQTEFIEITDYDKIPEIINDYIETIEDIGPNPFKDL